MAAPIDYLWRRLTVEGQDEVCLSHNTILAQWSDESLCKDMTSNAQLWAGMASKLTVDVLFGNSTSPASSLVQKQTTFATFH